MQRSIVVIVAVLVMMGIAGCAKISGTPNENPPMRVCTVTHPVHPVVPVD